MKYVNPHMHQLLLLFGRCLSDTRLLIPGTQKHRCASPHKNLVRLRHRFEGVGRARPKFDGIYCHGVRVVGNLLIAPGSERVITVKNGVLISWKGMFSLGSASGAVTDRWGLQHT